VQHEKTMCMQLNPHVAELSLFDIAGTPGVACDISHCNTKAIVKVSPHVNRSYASIM
jgi:malate/lactate dehydrogenase